MVGVAQVETIKNNYHGMIELLLSGGVLELADRQDLGFPFDV
jgi:hypothetical protein